ncbi:glycosyltransferase [Parasulfitobacter algicola]|uniref:Rhamnosyl transferase n=1 Tax=Parasulfitobacter algicola TaxID=2614809 RepID=A0ABX2IXG3_9RHOB|nr:glycosyltransferase [Sulfitobacter algicola]NSX55747.1 hypothetical protein [Sulfitobacter algicola]
MQRSFKNQIIGLIRFSYPTTDGFRSNHPSIKDAEDFLYAPKRLDHRFDLFEKFTLPSLRAQTDQNFTMILLTGEMLPAQYNDRLINLVQDLPFVHIMQRPSLPHYRAIKQAFKSVDKADFTHRTTFRLDDDDALDNRFVEKLRHHSGSLAVSLAKDVPTVLSFNKGLYVDYTTSPPEIFDAIERTPLSVGTAMIAPIDYVDNIYRRNHRLLGQFYNIYSSCDDVAYIRTIHAHNDSKPAFSGKVRGMAEDKIDHILKQGFGLTRTDIMSL